MRELSNEALNKALANSMEALRQLPDVVENDPLIQTSLHDLMKSEDRIIPRFLGLLNDHPQIATQILKSSVAGLTSLHVAHTVKAELKRRAEAN